MGEEIWGDERDFSLYFSFSSCDPVLGEGETVFNPAPPQFARSSVGGRTAPPTHRAGSRNIGPGWPRKRQSCDEEPGKCGKGQSQPGSLLLPLPILPLETVSCEKARGL